MVAALGGSLRKLSPPLIEQTLPVPPISKSTVSVTDWTLDSPLLSDFVVHLLFLSLIDYRPTDRRRDFPSNGT